MKVVAITGVRTCEIVDRPDPRIADNYVRVEIHTTPMCTEVGDYRNGNLNDHLGHEAAGVVIESAPGLRVQAGDRVVVMPQNSCGKCFECLSGEHIRCQTTRNPSEVTGMPGGRATYAQEIVQQDWLLLPIPDDISTDQASMAGCGLGPTFGAVEAMSVGSGDTLLIAGLGPVGMGGIVNGVVRGARVIGIESHPWRKQLALDLGAIAVIDPASPDALAQIQDLTDGKGADCSIEASSSETAPDFLLRATRVNGQLASVGWGGPVNMRDVVRRGVTIQGIWHWNHLRYARQMWSTIRRAGPLIDRLVTHRFPMTQVQAAWELQMTGECGKVLLDPRA